MIAHHVVVRQATSVCHSHSTGAHRARRCTVAHNNSNSILCIPTRGLKRGSSNNNRRNSSRVLDHSNSRGWSQGPCLTSLVNHHSNTSNHFRSNSTLRVLRP